MQTIETKDLGTGGGTKLTAPKQYFEWMETLRGLGVLLVLFGHLKPHPFLLSYLQSIMLALFIFAAGFLFNAKNVSTSGVYLKKRFRILIVPYFWFTVLTFVFWVVLFGGISALLGSGDGAAMPDAIGSVDMPKAALAPGHQAKPGPLALFLLFLLPALYGNSKFMWYNLPLWFLPGIFMVDWIFTSVFRKCKTERKLLAWLIVLSLLGFVIGRTHLPFPWNVDTAMMITVYYGLGYIFRQRYGEGWHWPWPIKLLVALALLGVSFFFIWLNPDAHPSFNWLGNLFYYHAGALSGVLAFMLFSQLLAKLHVPPESARTAPGRAVYKILGAIPALCNYFGRHSLIVIGVQVPAMSLFMTFNHLVFGMMVKEKIYSTGWAFYFMVGASLLMVPMIYAINRWAPWMLGRQKKKKAAPSAVGSPPS